MTAKYHEHTTKSGHKIRIWDDLYPLVVRSKIMRNVLALPFFGAPSYDTQIWTMDSKIVLHAELNDWQMSEFGFFTNLPDEVKPQFDELLNGRAFQSAWVNLNIGGTPHRVHPDSDTPNSISFLYYANLEWSPQWDGYTIFRSADLSEIEYVSDYVPGRLIAFDSCIPHKATHSAPEAPHLRYIMNQIWA